MNVVSFYFFFLKYAFSEVAKEVIKRQIRQTQIMEIIFNFVAKIDVLALNEAAIIFFHYSYNLRKISLENLKRSSSPFFHILSGSTVSVGCDNFFCF